MASLWQRVKAAVSIGNNDSWSNPEPKKKQIPQQTIAPQRKVNVRALTTALNQPAQAPKVSLVAPKITAPKVPFVQPKAPTNTIRIAPNTQSFQTKPKLVSGNSSKPDPIVSAVKAVAKPFWETADYAKSSAQLAAANATGNRVAANNARINRNASFQQSLAPPVTHTYHRLKEVPVIGNMVNPAKPMQEAMERRVVQATDNANKAIQTKVAQVNAAQRTGQIDSRTAAAYRSTLAAQQAQLSQNQGSINQKKLQEANYGLNESKGRMWAKTAGDMANTASYAVAPLKGAQLATMPVKQAVRAGAADLATNAALNGAGSGLSTYGETGDTGQAIKSGLVGAAMTVPLMGVGYMGGKIKNDPSLLYDPAHATNAFIKATDNMPTPTFNEKGFITAGRTPKYIHPDDASVMAQFIDHARGINKQTGQNAYNLEMMASDIADRYGIPISQNKGVNPVTRLANAFDQRLQADTAARKAQLVGQRGSVTLTDENGNVLPTFTGKKTTAKVNDPTAALKQEALKYKSAEEFLQAKANEGKTLADTLEPFGKRTPEQADLENLHYAVNLGDNLPDNKTAIRKFTDLYNQAHQSAPVEKTTPADPLEALKAEARKYKSAEEFMQKSGLMAHDLPTMKFDYDQAKADFGKIKTLAEDSTVNMPDATPAQRKAYIKKTIEGVNKKYGTNLSTKLDDVLDVTRAADDELNNALFRSADNAYKDLYNQAHQSAPVEKTAPADPLEALKAEARKYKSAEEFTQAIQDGKVSIPKGSPEQIAAIQKQLGMNWDEAYKTPTGVYDMQKKVANDLYNQAHAQPTRSNVRVQDGVNMRPDAEERVFAANPLLPKATSRASNQKTVVQELSRQPQTSSDAQLQSRQSLQATPSSKQKLERNVSSFDDIPEHPSVTRVVKEYAQALKSLDDGAGVTILPDGRRVSDHTPFYRNYFAQNKRKPSMQAWEDEARLQLENGGGNMGYNQAYKRAIADANNPELQSLLATKPAKELTPLERNKQNAQALRREVLDYRDTLTPVKKTGGESNIPVRKMSQDGDVITATNVNPNVKVTEKRYTLADDGQLLEDKNGAYRIFSDEDGKVQGFRIGDEYYSAKDLGDLSDVNDYGSSLATMRRNVERSFGKETGEKVSRFLVDDQQARATAMIDRQVKYKKGLEQLQQDLGISFKIGRGKAKKVSAAIQDFGEGVRDKQSLIDEFGKEYAGKIVAADKWFRTQYDSLLGEMNDTLTKYGYDPVPKRKNYYTHFQQPSLWQSFGLKMQEIRNLANPTLQDAMPDAARGKIDNALAGQSEFTLPNRRFNPFAQRRTGDIRTADAFGAFERYLNPTLNNIYMTPSITRARVLARAIAQDANLAGKDANAIIVQTREWANRLAGKSQRWDRPIVDSKLGRKYLKAANWAQRKAGQNTIVGNLSVAAMQPVMLTQAAGRFGYKNTLLAVMQEMSTAHAANAPIRRSAFLRRRYADVSSPTAGKMDAAKSMANKPLETIEESSTRITWNAAHNDALSKGLKGDEAIRYADIETEKTVAGRSIGERPEAFESKAAGPFSMYQLEVNNYWQQVGKEMVGQKHFVQAGKVFVAAYGFNLLLQQLTGRQVGFNPIDAAIDSYQETQKDGKSAGDKAKTIGQRWAGEFVDNTPFVAPIANTIIGEKGVKGLTGNDSSTGRFGVASPLRSLYDNPWYAVSPFGGSQAKKTVKGVKAVADGKLTDKNGETTVEVPQTPGNFVRGALFGPSAIPEVNAYYSNIGKKKVDQVEVPNQTDSKAARMGQTPSKLSTSDQIKAAFTTKQGKEMLALKNEDERKAWAQQSEDNAAMYKQYSAMKKTLDARDNVIDTPKSLSSQKDAITALKRKEAGFTDTGKANWYKKYDTSNDELYKAVQKTLPAGWDDLPKTNETVSKYVDMTAKWEKATTKIEKNDIVKEFLKTSYQSTLNDSSAVFFAGSKYNTDQKLAAVLSGDISQEDLAKAVKLDNYLFSKGLESTLAISNSLRSKLGVAAFYKSGSGGSGSRRSGKSSSTSNKFNNPNLAIKTLKLARAPTSKPKKFKIVAAKKPTLSLKKPKKVTAKAA